MTYDSTQGNFLLSLNLPHDSTQWGLELGPRSWCQDLRVGGRAEEIEPGPRGRGLEPGSSGWSQGMEARAGRYSQGPGGCSQGLGAGARAWGL